jgi:hypothetical protein
MRNENNSRYTHTLTYLVGGYVALRIIHEHLNIFKFEFHISKTPTVIGVTQCWLLFLPLLRFGGQSLDSKLYKFLASLVIWFKWFRSCEEPGLAVAKRSISLDRENTKTRANNRDPSLDNNLERKNSSRQTSTNKIPPFLLLSQVSVELSLYEFYDLRCWVLFENLIRIHSMVIKLVLLNVDSIVAVTATVRILSIFFCFSV